jgi:hypothetical protein
MVQGDRLYTYADYTCQEPGDATTYVCTGGLLVSMDGGKTWKPASIPSPQLFCGLALAPTGTVMFAITSSQCNEESGTPENTIWRSDDAGAHWTPMSQLQFNVIDSVMVVPSAGAAYPTVYLTTSVVTTSVATPQNQSMNIDRTTAVQVSQDGGKTWNVVPNNGIPPGWRASGVIAQTSVGSAIALCGPAEGPIENLYTWQPGATRWQLLAPVPPVFPTMYLVTPSPAGQGNGDTLWAISVSQKQQGNGLLFTNVVYRLQLSA